jgi:crotonobetainyl-CoA:carnitine CoA-transferase CaiB-like acyl-CoA transferase
MARLLGQFRVLDLTNVLSGPFCCHQLAHLGAEVIKVEIPETGDLARQLGADAALNASKMGVSFLAQNAGKRSLTLNLKTDRGKAVLRRLVIEADVLVENFRPGVMDRLGVGYEILKQDNPGLIYCAISGFGQDGPMRDLPAYDQIIQGLSGLMSITGAPETAPYRVGYPIADTVGGLTAALAVLAALAGRPERHQGGCFIDVSMLEATIATMGWVVSNYLVAGKHPSPMGNDNFTASPSGAFETGHGLLNIAANKQSQFETLCRVLNKPELIDDSRFSDRQSRLMNRERLKSIVEEALKTKTAQEWQDLLNAAGVPAGRVLTVPEALEQPQIADRELIASFQKVPRAKDPVRVVRTGIKIDGQSPAVQSPPPELGQHTREILSEVGFSHSEMDEMARNGVI